MAESLPGGGHGDAHFRQRRAQRDDAGADDHRRQLEETREKNRRADEKIGPEGDRRPAGGQQQQILGDPLAECPGDLPVGDVPAARRPAAPEAGADGVTDGQQVLKAEQVVEEAPEAVFLSHARLGREQEQGIGDIDQQHGRRLEPREMAVPGEQAEEGGRRQHDGSVAADHFPAGAHGRQGAGQSRDQQQVGHVGADDRAQDHAALLPEDGRQRRSQLGHRGAQRHQGKADDELRYAELLGQRGRRPHEKVRALDQQQQARPEKQHLRQHGPILP